MAQFNDSVLKENVIIIVVDDGSTDGTLQWVKKHFPEVVVLQGDGSLWWSGSINMGVEYSLANTDADFILWWNNDIISSEDYFKNLFEILSQVDENHLVGSKIFRLNENKVWGMGGKFDPVRGTKFMYGEMQPDIPDLQMPLRVEWFPGMGTTIHRNVYREIGLLDNKNFPQYHGDSDFTYRAAAKGYVLKAYPQLRIYNDVSNTGLRHDNSFRQLTRSLTSIKSNYNIKKDLLFYKKHSNSIRAYTPLINKYGKYIGGYFKWKILGMFGKQRTS